MSLLNSEEKFLKEFNDASKGISKYISIDSLVVGVPYEILRFRLHESIYGQCLIADLTIGSWLVLPKRIGKLVTSEEQVQLLNSKGYWLVFNGRNEAYQKMAIIEFKTFEEILESFHNTNSIIKENG